MFVHVQTSLSKQKSLQNYKALWYFPLPADRFNTTLAENAIQSLFYFRICWLVNIQDCFPDFYKNYYGFFFLGIRIKSSRHRDECYNKKKNRRPVIILPVCRLLQTVTSTQFLYTEIPALFMHLTPSPLPWLDSSEFIFTSFCFLVDAIESSCGY